ncbi:MAG TPA: glycoside hydrolase family 76 protein, partial [Verrucomicrobiae bacterium]|nr:glycoside hydrolase family 76 protein [Verrucomicrobiae bacterium]
MKHKKGYHLIAVLLRIASQNRLLFAAFGVFMFLSSAATKAPAFSTDNATSIWNSYNDAFYVGNNGNAYYHNSSGSGQASFWNQAEEIEMAVDRYKNSRSSSDLAIVTALCNGFIWEHGNTWTSDPFNDDILWACIAFERAATWTGNSTFKADSKNNFDAVYSRAYDSSLGGGLWWTTSKTSKNACVNGPGALAAYLLYTAYNDSSYLTKAHNIYNWELSHLVSSSGQVYDHENANGTIDTSAYTYNEGTFVGAANYLGDIANAELAATWTMHNKCTMGILPNNNDDTQSDGAGFNGICLRWIARFMEDQGKQDIYSAWIYHNVENALDYANSSDGLCWCDWLNPTPSGSLYGWGCSDAVVAMQVVPPFSFNPSVVNLPGGNLQLFGISGSGGTVESTWQTSANGPWYNGWQSLSGTVAKVVAAANADGTLQIFGLAPDQTIWTSYRTSSGAWSSWIQLPSNVGLWDFTVTHNSGGGLQIFGNGTSGSIKTIWENSANSYTNWSGWSTQGYTGSSSRGIAAASEQNGLLHVFCVATNGNLYHMYENSDGSWSAPASLGGTINDISVATWPDGHLEVFAACPDGALFHIWETA